MYFGNVGERIRELRKEKKLTQKELAKRIAMSESIIQKYEANKITDMPYKTIELIAKALDTTASYLTGANEFEADMNKMNGLQMILKSINCSYHTYGCNHYFTNHLDANGNYVDEDGNSIIGCDDPEFGYNECSTCTIKEPFYMISYNNLTYKIPCQEFDSMQDDIISYIRFKLHELLSKYEKYEK